MQRIVIDPVTRIEGHAKISIFLDDDGQVSDARFHVTEFRGFERFCLGRPFWEMAGLSARICGICPVSHLLASSRAGDAHPGGAGAARRREAAAADEPWPDHPVARSELLSSQRPRPHPGLGQPAGEQERVRPDSGRPRPGARRHPPAPVRPGNHRVPRGAEDPSRLDGPRRRPRTARPRDGATTS